MEVRVVRRHGPARMWIMLVISLLMLVPLGILSNVTHSLVLTLEVYHMLYNVLTLVGWLLAVRMDAAPGSRTHTFGWARLEVLTTVTTLLFLTALCFSISVESVQSLANAGHTDDMHYPVYVMACAAAVLLANLVCYILIGGFTSFQSTLLAPSERARHLSPAASEAQLRPDSRLAYRQPAVPLVRHYVRDLGGAVLLIVSAVTGYMCRPPIARYVDPALALLAVGMLIGTSHVLFNECCLILLETMPATFDAATFRTRLLATFPAVQDVHELHVWQLTPDCVVATAHVVLAGPQQFNDVAERVTAFFAAHAVGSVTLQPEFSGAASRGTCKSRCLLPCSVDSCAKSRCCDEPVLRRVPTIRVTSPSQVSLVSRGGRDSVGWKTADSVGQTKDQNRGTSVNGDCVKRAPELQGVPESDKINGDCVKHAPEPQGVPRSDKANAAGSAGTAVVGGTRKDSPEDVRKTPVPAPRGNAAETPVLAPRSKDTEAMVPTSDATEASAPTEVNTREPVPSECAEETTIPSEGATKPLVPSERATAMLSPTENITETQKQKHAESIAAASSPTEIVLPSEGVTKTSLPTESAAVPPVPYGSVSSVGDWHDAE